MLCSGARRREWSLRYAEWIMETYHMKRTRSSCCHECNVTLELGVAVNMGTVGLVLSCLAREGEGRVGEIRG